MTQDRSRKTPPQKAYYNAHEQGMPDVPLDESRWMEDITGRARCRDDSDVPPSARLGAVQPIGKAETRSIGDEGVDGPVCFVKAREISRERY